MKAFAGLLCFVFSMTLFADEATSIIDGSWTPGSRVYEGGPGEMEIIQNKISFIDCRDAGISVISMQSLEGPEWNGIDKDREVRPYKDLVIALQESSTCKKISKKIMRFLIPANIPGYASLMLYTTEEDYRNGKFNAWGGYHYTQKP